MKPKILKIDTETKKILDAMKEHYRIEKDEFIRLAVKAYKEKLIRGKL